MTHAQIEKTLSTQFARIYRHLQTTSCEIAKSWKICLFVDLETCWNMFVWFTFKDSYWCGQKTASERSSKRSQESHESAPPAARVRERAPESTFIALLRPLALLSQLLFLASFWLTWRSSYEWQNYIELYRITFDLSKETSDFSGTAGCSPALDKSIPVLSFLRIIGVFAEPIFFVNQYVR